MPDLTEKNERTGIQVISRAAAILRVLKQERGGLSLGQIARRVGLPRSTVQRIIGALTEERFVIADRKEGGFRLGPELGAFAEAANFNVVERCRAILSDVTQATGETTDLAAFRGGSMVFLDQVPGLHRLRTVSSVGEVFPLTTTANGRACLALMPPDMARDLIERENPDNAGPIQTRLEAIRTTGLAYDNNEHTPGISAIGFAFRDLSGTYHAVSVPVPSTRFDQVKEPLEVALRRAKARIEREFSQDS